MATAIGHLPPSVAIRIPSRIDLDVPSGAPCRPGSDTSNLAVNRFTRLPAQVKCFATSISISLSCVISIAFLGMDMTQGFIAGTALVRARLSTVVPKLFHTIKEGVLLSVLCGPERTVLPQKATWFLSELLQYNTWPCTDVHYASQWTLAYSVIPLCRLWRSG